MKLKSSRIRGILAINNVRMVDPTQRDLFFKMLIPLAETYYFGMHCSIRVIVTGINLEITPGLNQRIHINDDTEREGTIANPPDFQLLLLQMGELTLGRVSSIALFP